MKKPTRLLRVVGAMSLVASLLVGAFGVSSVVAQAPEDPFGPVVGAPGVYFPWVANDDQSTGLGPADTAITIQNLDATDATIFVYRGIGTAGLGGDNGWELIGPFTLEAHASKTFSAAALGIAEGEGAPIAVVGYTLTGEIDAGFIADYNQDGDDNDYETIADEDFPYNSGSNSWINSSPAEEVSWNDGDCLVVDIDPNLSNPDSPLINVYPAGYDDGGAVGIPGGTYPGQPGANLDGNAGNCTATEANESAAVIAPSNLGGVAKQAVDGENLPYTSEADTAVSGYTGLAGWELIEVGNEAGPYNGWYLPVVQTNGGPGGAWNSIIRVANFGDAAGTIGAAGVVVSFYPADDAAGELNQSFSVNLNINVGETQSIDLSDRVPEGWIGSAHISSDAPVFAMVDRVKAGYNMWLTNTASNALVTSEANASEPFVLYAPDVRKDFFGWNTGINVANLADHDNTVTIQYLGDIGTANQTATMHSKGMTYFYDPSQAPQDNNAQDPTTDPNANSGEIGAAILIADYPIAAAIDATKYPESTSSSDPNIFQGLSYNATQNLWFDQAVPLVQKGNPDTGMGATSGIQLFNPLDGSSTATVTWYLSSGDTAGNPIPVVINPNAMTFVYTMTDAQLSVGFLGSATIDASSPIAVVSTQVDYQVQFDGSAVWNGYNPAGSYRDQGPQPDSIMDVFTYLTPIDEGPITPQSVEPDASLQQADGDVAIGSVEVFVYAEGDCGNDLIESGTTDANGEVEFEVEPGYYCVEADPNGDGTMTSIDNVYIEPGDTDLDVDAVFVEEAEVAIADVTVQGTQCYELVDEVETVVECEESTTAGTNTEVTLVKVADLNALCADVDYSGANSIQLKYNWEDDTFEAPVVPGLYCAMADMDGLDATIDKIYSANPFEMPSGDPGENAANADEHLAPLAILDVQVLQRFGENAQAPLFSPLVDAIDLEVEIFSGATCGAPANSLGIFHTNADGAASIDDPTVNADNSIVSLPVSPGDYCAQADPNNDGTVTTVSGSVPLGDPSYLDTPPDIDITIVEDATLLVVNLQVNGRGQGAPTLVTIYAGADCTGTPLASVNSGMFWHGPDREPTEWILGSLAVFIVGPGEYCASADPNGDADFTTGTDTVGVSDSDFYGVDININEVTTVADLLTAGPDCAVASEPTDCPSTGGEGMSVTILLKLAESGATTCPTDAAWYADGTEAFYDVEGDGQEGNVHAWEANVSPGLYCAMADKDDAVYPDTPLLFSDVPFQITTDDSDEDVDERLGAFLDVTLTVSQEVEGNTTSLPAGGYTIWIYEGDATTTNETNPACELAETQPPDYAVTTDAAGDAQLVVNVPPGAYCAAVFAVTEDWSAAGTDVLGITNLEVNDPGDDTDITLDVFVLPTSLEDLYTGFLDVQVLDPSGAPVNNATVHVWINSGITTVDAGQTCTTGGAASHIRATNTNVFGQVHFIVGMDSAEGIELCVETAVGDASIARLVTLAPYDPQERLPENLDLTLQPT